MYSNFLTASLYGLNGEKTWVEVECENGLPAVSIVGLADQSVKEARERIHAAIINCEFEFPSRRFTVNLTPANKRKDGSHYDLPIALAVIESSKLAKFTNVEGVSAGRTAFFGELTLSGNVNPIEGALPMIIGLQKAGVDSVFLPAQNLKEAMLVKGIKLYPVISLKQAILHLTGQELIAPVVADGFSGCAYTEEILDFSDIKGQEMVKRAAQVAAAGMHGMLMIGPPGVGKSMIGKRIPGILPPLSYEEQLESTQIYSVAGELSESKPMVFQRPYRAPHHSMTSTALIGGGNRPKPGEISLAHNGVLFLDELAEFSVQSIDMLRQPIEDCCVSINRVYGKVIYPSRFMLVAAMNPCKCGYYGDPVKPCTCTETDRKRYLSKVSGPLLYRIDIHISLSRTVYAAIAGNASDKYSTEYLRQGVVRANEIQVERYKDLGIHNNSQLSPSMIEKYCALDSEGEKIMSDAFSRWNLSARSYHRILKVARTIADISGCENINEDHLLEALSYRMPDKFFSE